MAIGRFSKLHYYDQDFVDIYQRVWSLLDAELVVGVPGFSKSFYNHGKESIDQYEACMSTFFLVYSNGVYSAANLLDNFYNKQEGDGAIRGRYSLLTGEALLHADNPAGLAPPLFAWAEYNIYQRVGLKKRLKDILPTLEKYFQWLEDNFLDENGLYKAPLDATRMGNMPRDGLIYPIDFNAQQALNALYIARIADLLNDKDISLYYKQRYFKLKYLINARMWDKEDQFYYDLDATEQPIRRKTLASYWTLLAELSNESKNEALIAYLKDPQHFGTENSFPSLSLSDPDFSPFGEGYRGSIFPSLFYMVIKGLEVIGKYEWCRELTIKHIYFILDVLHTQEEQSLPGLFEAYSPLSSKPAVWTAYEDVFPRANHYASLGLSLIALMFEVVLGFSVSIPRKMVTWTVPSLEVMGIENFSLKKNFISITSCKSGRGWEVRLESEKLYYFTFSILNRKEKTLPIPSGRCSMLIEKI